VEHSVSLEGDVDSKNIIDFVYMLGIYLKRSFGLELDTSLPTKEKFRELSEVSLWGYLSRDAWATRLNFRFTAVGYPKDYFTPHSSRPGFLISCMVHAHGNGGDLY
jgi:hypothetical protein